MAANEVQHYPCSSCGADLLFEPKDGFLTCPYCGHKEAISESSEQVDEQSFEQHLQIRPEQLDEDRHLRAQDLWVDRLQQVVDRAE